MSNRDLSPEDKLQINQAKGRMPYGGMVHVGEIKTMDDLLVYLNKLTEVLEGVATRDAETEAELFRLQGLFRVGGQLLAELTKAAK